MRVVKNTLLQKAMERIEGRDYSELIPTLKGQTVDPLRRKRQCPGEGDPGLPQEEQETR